MAQSEELTRAKWVLLPGTLCTSEVFDPVLSALGVPENNRHAIAMDAPKVEDYAAPLREAVTGGEIICGFSLGSMVAAHNLGALAHARAIVLLACNPLPDPSGNRANREAVRDRVLRGEARDWITENWAAMSTAPGDTPREEVIRMAEATPHLIPAQTELAASRPGAVAQLEASALPLLFVTGSEDRLTPTEHVRPIVDTASHAHLSIVEGLGHFALLEAPDRMADAVRLGLSELLGDTR